MKEFWKRLFTKLTSMKVVVTLWCMVELTLIVAKGNNEFLPLAEILAVAPLAYCGANVAEKHILSKKENTTTAEEDRPTEEAK